MLCCLLNPVIGAELRLYNPTGEAEIGFASFQEPVCSAQPISGIVWIEAGDFALESMSFKSASRSGWSGRTRNMMSNRGLLSSRKVWTATEKPSFVHEAALALRLDAQDFWLSILLQMPETR